VDDNGEKGTHKCNAFPSFRTILHEVLGNKTAHWKGAPEQKEACFSVRVQARLFAESGKIIKKALVR
jgi:hypothetical protein